MPRRGKAVDLRLGDCLDVLSTLRAESVDAVVTDPPAGIKFMGKEWDTPGSFVERKPNRANRWDRQGGNHNPCNDRDRQRTAVVERGRFIAWMTPIVGECLRVARPGAILLCWAIPRTSHWTATAIEDAGWVIEDRIAHLFGQGFPKHKSKLKPACEDWWLARKPGPKWLGIEACRIQSGASAGGSTSGDTAFGQGSGWNRHNNRPTAIDRAMPAGRWPANVVLDESAAAALDLQTGPQRSGGTPPRRPPTSAKTKHAYGSFSGEENPNGIGSSAGAVSRFFYCPKASRRDRNEGLEGMPERAEFGYGDGEGLSGRTQVNGEWVNTGIENRRPRANTHPTVKSTDLMRWLCRLACPTGGLILDPFAGSGSTGKAAVLEGIRFLGIERDPEYHAIAQARIAAARASRRRRSA